MPAALSLRVDVQVLRDRRPGLEQRIARGLELGAREATEEYMQALEERLLSQNIPGPPLKPATIAYKRRKGGQFPDYKWLFHDIAIAGSHIITEGGLDWAVALLIAPAERPFFIYRLNELGGVNAEGKIIPARPLFTTTARQDAGRVVDGFKDGFYRGSGEQP